MTDRLTSPLSLYRNRVSRLSRGYATKTNPPSGSVSSPVPSASTSAKTTATDFSSTSPTNLENMVSSSTAPDASAASSTTTINAVPTDQQTAIAPPKTWLDKLPSVLQPVKPYLELIRIDKPIGTLLLYWPCGKFCLFSMSAHTYK